MKRSHLRALLIGGLAALTALGVGAGTAAGRTHTRALPGKGKPTFILGDKNFAEEYIVGDLYQQALQAQGYTVTLKPNIGSTEVTWKALTSGNIQGYPEYDGTLLSAVANISKNPKSSAAAVTETRRWLQKRGYTFSGVTPFTDADAIVVNKSYARAHRLVSIGNLKKLGKSVKLDGEAPFQTRFPDGLPGLKRYYGVVPTFTSVSIGSFYTLLDKGQANAIVGFTTDPPLETGKYTVLKDTKFIFGFQNVGLVVKRSVVEAEGPDFMKTINRVNALLNQKTIIALDKDAEVLQKPPAVIAKAFLKANHLT
ncbi:MAG: glycine betaine ABC transporter substrate-binding protein [Solirubrobacteraceae bacterium]